MNLQLTIQTTKMKPDLKEQQKLKVKRVWRDS